mgnify:CR=1 FL=1|jgi:restriction endonuclease S subunit
MIISEIRYSQVVERLRFDADYYLPEYLEIDNLLDNFNCVRFEEVIKSINAGKNLPQCDELYKYEKIPLIRTQNIRQILIDKTGLSFVQAEKFKEAYLKELKNGNLLVVRVGVGISDSVVVFGEFVGSAYSDNTIRIEVNSGKVNPFYLSVYLNSKYGKKYWERVQKGSARPLISYENIFEIKIPIPHLSFQQKIESFVKESYNNLKEADEKYKSAEALLNKTLGIENLELNDERVFESRFNEIISGQRLDADFYKPIFTLSLGILKNGEGRRIFSVKKLGEIAKISKGIEVGSDAYVDNGKLFLRVSNITEKEITISDSAEFIREDLFNTLKDKYKPIPGEILYTKDATIGIAFPVSKDFNDAIISGGIIRIKPHNVDQYYLALVLNSILCRSQAERNSIGAVIKHYNYSKIKDLLVPLVSEESQKQISDLVKQSFSLRKESKELLEKAKKEVEGFIEKNTNYNCP